MAEQDHDGNVDVDDGDVDLAPPHESLHQKTLVSRSTLGSCVMRSEGPLSHQPDGRYRLFPEVASGFLYGSMSTKVPWRPVYIYEGLVSVDLGTNIHIKSE